MSNIHCIQHPICEHQLSQLRREETLPSAFRAAARQLTQFIAIEATRHLQTRQVEIETPVSSTTADEISDRVGIFPILRAGLSMTDPILELLPAAEVFHLGMYRNEETAMPVEYYNKLSDAKPVDFALIVDPMLATGGSAVLAIEAIKAWGVRRIATLSLIASEEGISRVAASYPDIHFYTCAIDPILNSQKYIVPGLGDAGDRIFNTL